MANYMIISLRSSDGDEFAVAKAVVLKSQTIRHLIEDGCAENSNSIPLPNVTSAILKKVLEYCKRHVEEAAADVPKPETKEELEKWDRQFVDVDQATLFGVIMAANFLDIKELLDLACKRVAEMMKGKTSDEIRQTFNIKNDYTPAEEEEVRMQLNWAFD